MVTRRIFLGTAAAALTLAGLGRAAAQRVSLATVYKSPTCGCCGEWVKHMRANGFRIETRELRDLWPIRQRYGVPDHLASCHTAIVEGYAIEGHVPAGDIRRLILERPKLTGLTVPGMVPGSPGMEQGPPQRYATLAFNARESWVYARH